MTVLQHGCFYSNGNQYSFMRASFYLALHNCFFMNLSICGSSACGSRAQMVRVTILDIQVSLCKPTAMLEDSTTSVKMLFGFYMWIKNQGSIGCLLCWGNNKNKNNKFVEIILSTDIIVDSRYNELHGTREFCLNLWQNLVIYIRVAKTIQYKGNLKLGTAKVTVL